MSDVSVFPKNKDEAIAMLYVKTNAAGKTPEELMVLYLEAEKRIRPVEGAYHKGQKEF